MGAIEKIILSYPCRGMDTLKEYLPDDFCRYAAEEILSWKRETVILTTGFYVAGHAETDGPIGTVFLAKALRILGFHPVILTDSYCGGFFETEGIDIEIMPISGGGAFVDNLIDRYRPAGLIAIERCGKNRYGDYANMRGESIKEHTAPIDLLFERKENPIPSIGVGDGGNEIGMGRLADVITKELSLEPCMITTDFLVIATVSNWGAYGLIAYLELLTHRSVFPAYEEVFDYLKKIVKMGSVDGKTRENTLSVDGFGYETEKEIIDKLSRVVKERIDRQATSA